MKLLKLTGSRRIEQNLIPSMDYVIEVLNGSDGDYREAGARTLPKVKYIGFYDQNLPKP